MLKDSKLFFRVFALVILFTNSTIALFACFGNITDPHSNMQFIQHIFSMDTTYKAPHLMWRAITSPWLHWAGFGVLIFCEAMAAFFGFTGLYKMIKNIKADEITFEQHKTRGYIAFAIIVFIWGFIFQAVGGEWFASWQSEYWNGIRDATRIILMGISGCIALRIAK